MSRIALHNKRARSSPSGGDRRPAARGQLPRRPPRRPSRRGPSPPQTPVDEAMRLISGGTADCPGNDRREGGPDGDCRGGAQQPYGRRRDDRSAHAERSRMMPVATPARAVRPSRAGPDPRSGAVLRARVVRPSAATNASRAGRQRRLAVVEEIGHGDEAVSSYGRRGRGSPQPRPLGGDRRRRCRRRGAGHTRRSPPRPSGRRSDEGEVGEQRGDTRIVRRGLCSPDRYWSTKQLMALAVRR